MVRMAYTPRQVAVRAQEAAIEFLRLVARDHLVETFLDGYAEEFDRYGRAARPARRQELIEAINREALLSMISRMEAVLPQRLGFRAQRRLPPALVRARQQTIDLFREEFLVALGRGAEWQDEEFRKLLPRPFAVQASGGRAGAADKDTQARGSGGGPIRRPGGTDARPGDAR